MPAQPIIHFLSPDADMPDAPTCNHDYHPASDYELVNLPKGKTLTILKSVASEVAAKILPAFGMGGAVIFFVAPGSIGSDVARFVHGTASYPVIGLDMKAITRHAADLADELHATLAHEFGHGYAASLASDDARESDPIGEEIAVESFADDWRRDRWVSAWMIEEFAENCERRLSGPSS